MHIITIYYRTSDIKTIRKIQERFKFPKYMTVNGECSVIVDGKDWAILKETEERGFVEIRNKVMRSMKATELFIKRIEDYLKKEADKDPEFAKKIQEHPGKTPKVVCDYIFSEVGKAKRSVWADEEIFSMAKHFINDIEVKSSESNVNRVSRVVDSNRMKLAEVQRQDTIMKERNSFKRKAKEKKLQGAKGKREKDTSMMGDLFGGLHNTIEICV